MGVLYRARHRTKYRFVTSIVWLLLISNIVLVLYSALVAIADHPVGRFLTGLTSGLFACAIFVINATFNQGHWMFAYEYFKASRVMPYTHANNQVPETCSRTVSECNQIVYTLEMSGSTKC